MEAEFLEDGAGISGEIEGDVVVCDRVVDGADSDGQPRCDDEH